MIGIKYFKADSSTYVIKTVNGKTRRSGKGLSFFYNAATTSIAAIPVNAQEAPFIFNLQTSDFQSVSVQGQISFRVVDAETTAETLNFNLDGAGAAYASEDPMKLSDSVIRVVQSIVQHKIQEVSLRESLLLSRDLVSLLKQQLSQNSPLEGLGLGIIDVSVSAITPTAEASRALEAEVREAILKEADDAIYSRRKSAVEQERTIKEAELQTELSVQQKEQEIEESRIENERTRMRSKAETEQERIQAEIEAEDRRRELVALNTENSMQEADSEAYAIAAKMKAFRELPVENLKAMALANMQSEQLMALAFESLAQNAGKIGELNITPDLFGHLLGKAARS
jgi:regulator of protease activity HflC (stomatin/prohibitin superfamily)